MPERQQNFQNVAWFRDLATRSLLNMNPPYQRRSVWNQQYREEFVDTILLDYPAPAIFLYERIDDSGAANYAVVDGKQRLTTILDFIENRFPVGDESPLLALRSLYYEGLPREIKVAFLRYRFSVEYLPSENETEINSIFDRLNRNVKKLTPQELRHAKYDGLFITAAETLSEWFLDTLPDQFPRITDSSRKQMKDVEIVATLLLLLEQGPKSYSTAGLDEAFAERDNSWRESARVQLEFRDVVKYLSEVMAFDDQLPLTRLKNQADFYSLFGAVAELMRLGQLPTPQVAAVRLATFVIAVDNLLDFNSPFFSYYEAARSASNDAGPRKTRIDIIRGALTGEVLGLTDGSNGN